MKTLEEFDFEKIDGRSILGGYGTTEGTTATCTAGQGCEDDGSDPDT